MAAPSQSFLQLFWDLASLAEHEQTQAAHALCETLARCEAKGAGSHELQYALVRLCRGLASSRDNARPGFALALTQARPTPPRLAPALP